LDDSDSAVAGRTNIPQTFTDMGEGDSETAVAIVEKKKHPNPVIQEIVDALPPYFVRMNGDKDRRAQFQHAIALSTSVRSVITEIIMRIRDRHIGAINKLLVRLDNEEYNQRWLCPKCGFRWGTHDGTTLACPSDTISSGDL